MERSGFWKIFSCQNGITEIIFINFFVCHWKTDSIQFPPTRSARSKTISHQSIYLWFISHGEDMDSDTTHGITETLNTAISVQEIVSSVREEGDSRTAKEKGVFPLSLFCECGTHPQYNDTEKVHLLGPKVHLLGPLIARSPDPLWVFKMLYPTVEPTEWWFESIIMNLIHFYDIFSSFTSSGVHPTAQLITTDVLLF